MDIQYTPPPTGGKFMQSDAKVRLIKGPVGCLSADTEVLTPQGWVRMDSWSGQQIAEWVPETGQIHYRKPINYVVLPCSEFIHFHSKLSLSMVLSDEHRVPYYDWKGEFRVKSAADLARKPSCNTIPNMFVLPTDTLGLTDDQIRLWVAIAADGHYANNSTRCHIVVRKERKKDRLRKLLDANGVEFTEVVYPGRPTETRFSFKRPDHPKHFDLRWYSASSRELGVLVDELDYWDGLNEHEEKRFSTSLKDQADFVQFAAHATGRRAHISCTEYDNGWNPTYTVHMSKKPYSRKAIVKLRKDNTVIERVPSQDGKKYCFTTASGYFVARHNGRIFCTGNSGKSTVCLMEIFRRCAEMPHSKDGFRRSRWVIIRNTLQQLMTTTKKSWDTWFPDGPAGKWRSAEKTFMLEVGDIRAEILFLPLDTPDDTRKLLSLELTGAFINEARQVDPDIIQAIISRLGRYPSRAMLPIDPATSKPIDYWYGLIMDTNPPSRDSYLYEQFEEKKPRGWEIFSQPGGLDPDAENKENLPKTYYEDMMEGADEDFIETMVHGNYGRSTEGRPVYEKTFKRSFHVAEATLQPIASQAYPLIIGMDFGRTPAAVIGQRDHRGRALVLDALYVENIGLENFLTVHLKPMLNSKFPHNRYLIVGDPAGWAKSQINEESCFDILKKAGFEAVRAPTNDVDKRIAAVEKLLCQQIDGKPMMLFSPPETSPGMKHLVAAFNGGYKYRRKQNGSYDTTPLKDHYSHTSDATQYLALGFDFSGGSTMSQRRDIKPAPMRIV